MVKEKPLLMNTEMVCATLKDLKKQTRRLNNLGGINKNPDDWQLTSLSQDDYLSATFVNIETGETKFIKCPWQVGQELWVRETWADLYPESKPHKKIIAYRADGDKEDGSIKWKPSIFMPRWASRIQLRIKDIRVERVQDITPSDCEEEGITGSTHGSPVRGLPYEIYKCGDFEGSYPKTVFQELWESINANRKDKDGNILPYSWVHNPFVWVIEFEKLK